MGGLTSSNNSGLSWKFEELLLMKELNLWEIIFFYLGKDVELYTLSFGTEPNLISIYDNVKSSNSETYSYSQEIRC